MAWNNSESLPEFLYNNCVNVGADKELLKVNIIPWVKGDFIATDIPGAGSQDTLKLVLVGSEVRRFQGLLYGDTEIEEISRKFRTN